MIEVEYRDFSLKIEPDEDGGYTALVLQSPAGEGRSTFRLPFDPEAIGPLLVDLGQVVRGAQPTIAPAPPAAAGPQAEDAGDQLFDALFSGSVRSLLERSFGWRDERPGRRGLRIKLHIDPTEPSLRLLANLPWELLHYRHTSEFLSLSRLTPIIRYLNVQQPDNPVPLELPLRVLVVIASPPGYDPLDLDRERKLIQDSWAKQDNVEVEFIQRAAIQELQDRLVEKPYHILHFMGHGDFDQETGRGVILLEDQHGQAQRVDGETLGILLRDAKLGLVFLNACRTAQSAQGQGLNPFAGVATAMVLAGVPAVVAMQFPISDAAAITFAQRFYPLLARDNPVDAAVAEGRRAVRMQDARGFEWATPVLFMRVPQGRVFEVVPAPAPVERAPRPEPVEAEPPVRQAALKAAPAEAPVDQEPVKAKPAAEAAAPAKRRPRPAGAKGGGTKTSAPVAGVASTGGGKPAAADSQTALSHRKSEPAKAPAEPAPRPPIHPHLAVKLSARPGAIDAGSPATWHVRIKNDGDAALKEVKARRGAASLLGPVSLACGEERTVSFEAAYAFPGLISETVSVEALASNGQRITVQAEGTLEILPARPLAPDAASGTLLAPDEIRDLLKSFKQGRLYLDPNIPADKLAQARELCDVPAAERVLGLVTASMAALWQGWFLFGCDGIYYYNPKNVGFGQPGPGRICYAEFPQREFNAQWWMSRVALGPEQFFDGRWSEVDVKSLADILKALQSRLATKSKA